MLVSYCSYTSPVATLYVSFSKVPSKRSLTASSGETTFSGLVSTVTPETFL